MTHRHNALSRPWAAAVLGCCLVPAVHASPPLPATQTRATCVETKFLQDNAVAMDKMMADMDAPPTGDVDRDFVAMMVPHHQGAIDMAQLVLRDGDNEQIRRLAQEIIVTQQQEIIAMRMAVGINSAADATVNAAAGVHAEPHHHTSGASVASSENCP